MPEIPGARIRITYTENTRWVRTTSFLPVAGHKKKARERTLAYGNRSASHMINTGRKNQSIHTIDINRQIQSDGATAIRVVIGAGIKKRKNQHCIRET